MTIKYPGKMWSYGTFLVLVYWLFMLGMVVNLYTYYNNDTTNALVTGLISSL
jgi:hypothetical protein